MSVLALPYVKPPTWPVDLPLLGEQTITAFGPLVVTGVFLGFMLCMRLAKQRGLPEMETERLVMWVGVGGFAVAHWFSVLLYFPEHVQEDPWVLVRFTEGLSSVGGFIGGGLTFAILTRRWRMDPVVYADIMIYGLLFGFAIGRCGCSMVHDHPGALSTSALAVGPWPDGATRWDLGLMELFLLMPLMGVIYGRSWRRSRPGAILALVAASYAVLRFPLDFLRAEDVRYGPLTPAQYACIAIVITAGLWWRTIARRDFTPGDAVAAEPAAADDDESDAAEDSDSGEASQDT